MVPTCSKCYTVFTDATPKGRKGLCKACENCRLRAYRAAYKVKYGHSVNQKHMGPVDKVQVRAFKFYFEQFVENVAMSCEEAFVRAILVTDDEHVDERIRTHADEFDRWRRKDFGKSLVKGRVVKRDAGIKQVQITLDYSIR